MNKKNKIKITVNGKQMTVIPKFSIKNEPQTRLEELHLKFQVS